MSEVTLSLSVEVVAQPKQYHSVKMGIIIHEVKIEYGTDEELTERVMAIEEKYQSILNKAKNLAIEKNLYTGKIENLYDRELDSQVTLINGDQKQEDKEEYKNSLDEKLEVKEFSEDSDFTKELDIENLGLDF